MKTFVYKRRVFFYETDAQEVVHHSNYPRYFEEARGFFLEYIGYPYEKLREELNIDIVLIELKIKYIRPLKFGHIFEVFTQLKDLDRFFFSFHYTIKMGEKIMAEGFTRHCCINRKTKKIVSVPDFISDLV